MDIEDASKVKNNIKLPTVFFALVSYLILTLMTAGVALVLLIVIGLITSALIKNEIKLVSSDEAVFRKRYPFSRYGASFGDFQHVFSHDQNVLIELAKAMSAALTDRLDASALERVQIVDDDKDLLERDGRTFRVAKIGTTERGTKISLIVEVRKFGDVQSIRWWIMLGGFVDRDKRLRFILASPLTFWFWIIPYLKRDFSILGRIRNIYGSSYNDFDVVTQSRAAHDTIFNALISVLEKHDIDTSDLKVQRMQVMNINISGGKVQMGNVVQGAMNKVMSQMGGAAK